MGEIAVSYLFKESENNWWANIVYAPVGILVIGNVFLYSFIVSFLAGTSTISTNTIKKKDYL